MQEQPSMLDNNSQEKSTLRSEGLVKIYGKRTVVNDVSFNVSQGEILVEMTADFVAAAAPGLGPKPAPVASAPVLGQMRAHPFAVATCEAHRD